ncbi:hypothetical protein HYC85_032209 [Camellia sinensis]|uniref:Uncharacterized protein n=1 Tax=Camellia sinensis TaxID=4442 RepID=A0A7J7FWH7_CAMSI|nr:hypothetical protein HYC85_032209 [Camellia sinensis]
MDLRSTGPTSLGEHSPSLLLSNPKKTLLPKLEFFQSLGLSRTEVADLVASAPFLLRYSLKNRLIPALDFLKRVVLLDKRGVFALMLRPRFFWIHVDKNAIPNVALLRELGVPQSCISLFVSWNPSVVAGNKDKFNLCARKAIEMGFDPSKRHGESVSSSHDALLAYLEVRSIQNAALLHASTLEEKNDPSDISGPEEHRPVILPPTRAGGIRCFVKPTWRCALHSRKREPQAFA